MAFSILIDEMSRHSACDHDGIFTFTKQQWNKTEVKRTLLVTLLIKLAEGIVWCWFDPGYGSFLSQLELHID
jgi:hypothetical protein